MALYMHLCPVKFQHIRRRLKTRSIKILDIGCGNHSPTITKHWFPGSYYAGADIQQYNLSTADVLAMDKFYLIGFDEAGYSEIPDDSFDFVILSHVIEHMPNAAAMLKVICSKLKPSGYIWIAFPSPKSLGFPSAEGTLQFCDDPTHVYVPDIREVSNVLLKCGMKVLHAGRSRDRVREFIGAMILPWAFLKRSITGRLSARGLWNIMGFEDHVFAQRKDF